MTVATRLVAVIVLGLPFMSQAADACDYQRSFINIDKPIKQIADCSFRYGGRGFGDEFADRGAKAINIGDGVVAQKLMGVSWCLTYQSMLVVDCKKRESAIFVGAKHPEAPLARIVRFLQPPYGKLNLTPGVSIDSLISIAESEGYEYYPNAQARLKEMKRRNRFDPYCGCKVYYPNSTGAAG